MLGALGARLNRDGVAAVREVDAVDNVGTLELPAANFLRHHVGGEVDRCGSKRLVLDTHLVNPLDDPRNSRRDCSCCEPWLT